MLARHEHEDIVEKFKVEFKLSCSYYCSMGTKMKQNLGISFIPC